MVTIYYCGRTDDMFKVSGMWVSPFDVEAALTSHEAVLEAAVIGKEDADGLIKPKAFIVLRNGFKADQVLLDALKLHVKDKAGPWKFPRWIEAADNATAHSHRQAATVQATRRGLARRRLNAHVGGAVDKRGHNIPIANKSLSQIKATDPARRNDRAKDGLATAVTVTPPHVVVSEACSARELMFDNASSLLRVASVIAFEALLAKSCAAF